MKLCRIKRHRCESDREHQMIFAVVEDRGNRVVIAPVNCEMAIVPTELVANTDIDIIGDSIVN